MKRRIIGLGLALASACAGLTGCETLRPQTRSASNSSDSVERVGDKVESVKSEPDQGFFHASRLSGAMSDEGREVERNLGIR